MQKRILSPDEQQIVFDLFADMPTKQLAEQLGISFNTLTGFAYRRKLKKSDSYKEADKDRHLAQLRSVIMKTILSEEDHAFFVEYFPTNTNKFIGDYLGMKIGTVSNYAERHGLKKDPDYVKKLQEKSAATLISTGASHRFKKGNKPHNYNYKVSEETYKKMAGTMFKKGQPPSTAYPIGHEAKCCYGYWRIKTEQGLLYKHKYLWEQANGPIPDGFSVVFVNGKKEDCFLENLILLPNSDKSLHSKYCHLSREVRDAAFALAYLKRAIKKIKKDAKK